MRNRIAPPGIVSIWPARPTLHPSRQRPARQTCSRSASPPRNCDLGGHHLAFISQGWNLEHYLQVVERIGPVRQKQAGHERPVFLYHIVAKDTLDEVVAARTDEKKSVQEELLNYMKRRGKK